MSTAAMSTASAHADTHAAAVTQAMVLAAGLGTRMRPVSATLPKPLVPVAGMTLIDRVLNGLAAAGVAHAVVNTSYLADLLEAHLRARMAVQPAPRLTFSREDTPLETGGGILHALPHFGGTPFFVANADVVWTDGPEGPAFHRLEQVWRAIWHATHTAPPAVLLLQPVEQATGYQGAGDFFLDPFPPSLQSPLQPLGAERLGSGLQAGILRRRGNAPHAPYVFSGMQVMHPTLFSRMASATTDAAATGGEPQAFSLNRVYDTYRRADDTLEGLVGLVHTGGWYHVGDPAGLAAAEAQLGG